MLVDVSIDFAGFKVQALFQQFANVFYEDHLLGPYQQSYGSLVMISLFMHAHAFVQPN